MTSLTVKEMSLFSFSVAFLEMERSGDYYAKGTKCVPASPTLSARQV
jgi:hypothetical protein